MKKIVLISGIIAVLLSALLLLGADNDDKIKNFNAAQAAYRLGEYEKALEYYEKAEDCAEKYLNSGNIFFKAGDALEENEQKTQCYIQALQIYAEGINKFPRDVPLKYNYEILKEKTEATPENSEDTDQENTDPSDGEEGEEEEQDSEENQEDGEDGEEQGSEQQEEYSEGEEGEEGETNNRELDEEAIGRILQMLENQEEESLKNNREIVSGGKGQNEW